MIVATIVGARPQFIKAAAISRRMRDPRFSAIKEHIIHTGQHFDDNMSATFFRDLEIPEPYANLGIHGGSQSQQTAAMMIGLESAIEKLAPDLVLVYGDTNSTLAASLVAAKAGIKLAHVEAGLRSFRRAMPEEINRVVTDRLSDILFCPTKAAAAQLQREGSSGQIHVVGDVMFDSFRHVAARSICREAPNMFGLRPGAYVLATIHRAENTDDSARLNSLVTSLGIVARDIPVVLPLHPRTRQAMAKAGIPTASGVLTIEPQPYEISIGLVCAAAAVATDSGGMQKEAYFAAVPCVTLRDETEWTETIDAGWNRLSPPGNAEGTAQIIKAAIDHKPAGLPKPIFGTGDSASHILSIISGDAEHRA